MDYSERLNEIIKKKKITQTELAAKMKAKQQTVSSWINKRYPNLKGIEKICDALGIEMWEFFIDRESMLKIYGISPEAFTVARGRHIDP